MIYMNCGCGVKDITGMLATEAEIKNAREALKFWYFRVNILRRLLVASSPLHFRFIGAIVGNTNMTFYLF